MRAIIQVEPDGKYKILADRYEGKRFNSPNDLDVDPKGNVYFTDPRYVGDDPRDLDFEAVFFVGIDRLAADQPELFDKYLYVGTTRAATYLGLTCDVALPAAMSVLKPHFAADWTSH